MMKIMAKPNPKITFEGKTYTCDPEKTLLDNLLSQNAAIPYSCLEGVCFACLAQATKGQPTAHSQLGISEQEKEAGFFLPCQCKAQEDMDISINNTRDNTFSARLIERMPLHDSIYYLSLECPLGFEFHPGQFINITHPQTLAIRSYSIASIESDGFINLHIKHYDDGELSTWLCKTLQLGEEVTFTGPNGTCFHENTDPNQLLILAGTSTGLAPLWGILRNALSSGHKGPIYLFHYAKHQGGLYYQRHIQSLAEQHNQLTYRPCIENDDIVQIITQTISDVHGAKAYLCGATSKVQAMQKHLFFSGVARSDIHADAFTPASSPID
jgi:CDP-4-dehydro-6-deoxyglucose reductase